MCIFSTFVVVVAVVFKPKQAISYISSLLVAYFISSYFFSCTTMFSRHYPMASYASSSIAEVPPADWCLTTLRSLSNKYEHLSDSRKCKPLFAEAVLNSFKTNLLDLMSTQSFCEPDDDFSDSEATSDGWPIEGADGDRDNVNNTGSSSECVYDSAAATNANSLQDSYLTISPSDVVGSTNNLEAVVEDAISTRLLSPSPSPTNIDDNDDNEECGGDSNNNDELVTLPPNIEEALRRFLANNSSQVLTDTFSTFAAASADTSLAAAIAEDNEGQFITDSGSCSPNSPASPEEPLDFLSTADPVDVFVKHFANNDNASIQTTQQQEPLSPSSSSDGEEDDTTDQFPPCKRKRGPEIETKTKKQSLSFASRHVLPVSPRKRSRSLCCDSFDAAAVIAAAVPTSPTAISFCDSGAPSPPPLLSLTISSDSDIGGNGSSSSSSRRATASAEA